MFSITTKGRKKDWKKSEEKRNKKAHLTVCVILQAINPTVANSITELFLLPIQNMLKKKTEETQQLDHNVFLLSFMALNWYIYIYIGLTHAWVSWDFWTYDTLVCDTYNTHLCTITQRIWVLLASLFFVLTRSLLAYLLCKWIKNFEFGSYRRKLTNLWQIRILIIVKSITYNPLFYSSEVRSDL